jgi:ParB-like chromosome segregation protein Spo0J
MSNRAETPTGKARFSEVPIGPGTDSPAVPAIESYPVTSVKIAALVVTGSPRTNGEDPEHTLVLAESHTVLPPIAVHRPTMRVIDGMHRVRAALLNGKQTIDARLLDCDEATAFVLAVTANITHGLPLSQQDRKTAAIRIIVSHPQWSDRAVAASTGLSDKTVSGLRSRATADDQQSDTRLGRDGRLRPLNSAARRQQAAELILEKPEAGLREIARATGLSPATVRDVRERTDRGEDPVPQRYRPTDTLESPAPPSQLTPKSNGPRQRTDIHLDRNALLTKLMNDPSLRFNEAGRHTLRWLYHHTVDAESCERMGMGVPEHWATVVADLARSCATAWITLADRLEQQSEEEEGAS